MKGVHDIFAPGLIRGKHSFQHNPQKKVFYVEHPTEGWRVFLRAVCFIHEEGNTDMTKFIVAKKTGREADLAAWEAPKGQMEAKDGLAHPKWPVIKLLKENILRECEEEVKIRKFVSLEHIPDLIIQSQEEEYPPNFFFQYIVFRGIAKPNIIQEAAAKFAWYKEHPAAFARLSHDNNEKDDIAWYSPRHTKLMGRWSPTLTKLYLKYIKLKNQNLKYNMTARKTSRRKAPRRKMQKSRRMNRKNIVKQQVGGHTGITPEQVARNEYNGIDIIYLPPDHQQYCRDKAAWNLAVEQEERVGPAPLMPRTKI